MTVSPKWDHKIMEISLVPLSDSGRVVLKPCEYRKSGKNDTSV